jgi:hypothetical protein
MVCHLFSTKSFRSTNGHFSQVDDENYSEEEELNLDDSEDVRSSASEDDGQ